MRRDAALVLAGEYLGIGFNAIPIILVQDEIKSKIVKRPPHRFKVKRYREVRQSSADIAELFASAPDQCLVGLILGKLSPLKGYATIVIDFDSHELFHRFKDSLADILADTWVVETRRGFHVYVLIPEGFSLAGARLEFGREGHIDILSGGYAVAPGSFDEQFGVCYRFVNRPALPIILENPEALRGLFDAAGKEMKFLPVDSKKPVNDTRSPPRLNSSPLDSLPRDIPQRTRALIMDNAYAKYGYASRSEGDMAAVLSLAMRGFTYEQILEFFEDNAHAHSKFRSYGNPGTYVATMYRKATQLVDGSASETIRTFETFICRYEWPLPRYASTDRKVALALLKIAKRVGRKNFGASLRELAPIAALGKSTIGRSLQRLESYGCILISQSEDSAAALITLTPPVINSDRSPLVESLDSDADLAHDLWYNRRGSLGEKGRLVFHAIKAHHPHGARRKDIVDDTPLPSSTTYWLIDRMLDMGLIRAEGTLILCVPDIDLDALAQQLGLPSRSLEQRERYEKERSTFEQRKAELSKRTSKNGTISHRIHSPRLHTMTYPPQTKGWNQTDHTYLADNDRKNDSDRPPARSMPDSLKEDLKRWEERKLRSRLLLFFHHTLALPADRLCMLTLEEAVSFCRTFCDRLPPAAGAASADASTDQAAVLAQHLEGYLALSGRAHAHAHAHAVRDPSAFLFLTLLTSRRYGHAAHDGSHHDHDDGRSRHHRHRRGPLSSLGMRRTLSRLRVSHDTIMPRHPFPTDLALRPNDSAAFVTLI